MWGFLIFCYGNEENGRRACTNKHLTTADQGGIRKANPVPVMATRKMDAVQAGV
mgnify:CR=1 FL=1